MGVDKSYIRYEPTGVIFEILPWNFPVSLVVTQALQTLLAGNTILLKHSPGTPDIGVIYEKMMREAGWDNDEFVNV